MPFTCIKVYNITELVDDHLIASRIMSFMHFSLAGEVVRYSREGKILF